jgi:hypothetical protein
MTLLECWASRQCILYLVEADPGPRARLCRLLRSARLDCRAFRDHRTALAAIRDHAGHAYFPAVLVSDLRGDRHLLEHARAHCPALLTIGLSPLVRISAGTDFAPLRGLLGVDYLLPHPADPAELLATLLATLALAANESDDSDRIAEAC